MKNFKRVLLAIMFLVCINTSGYTQQDTPKRIDTITDLIKVENEEINWFNPMVGPFDVVGFEWIETDSVFRRLPLSPDWEIPEAVDNLANQTAGGQIRFKTNSKRILVKVVLSKKSNMYHMSPTGQSGFDLYVKDKEIQRYLKTTKFNSDSVQYQSELYHVEVNKLGDFTLNFPLYNGVNSLLIGLEDGAILKAPEPFTVSGKIVIYGTSITQGGCVSRPGILFSNILSRKLDTEFVNLGFSGNGKGEPELARLINHVKDTKLIILDYEANANKTIKNTLASFVDILRLQHPETPILIVSKMRFAKEYNENFKYERLISNRDFQKELVEMRKSNGDSNIYFLDGSTILGEDYFECTVDGVHPTDLGAYRIADAILLAIRDIL